MSVPEMWPAQREAVSFCLQRPAAMLDMGMGCGKTRVAIEVMKRREVARKLREMGEELGSSVLLWYHIAKILGVRTATDGKTACGMLADLIEPSERACYYYDAETNHCRCYDTRLVDRDALLALAEEMDAYTKCDDERCGREMPPRVIHDFARRIREALGEQAS